MVSATNRSPIVTRPKVVSIRDTIIISDSGGRTVVFVVVVEPVVCLKMPEGYPVSRSLKSRVMGKSLFDSMFVVPFKSNPVRLPPTVMPKLPANPFHRVVIALNIFLIVLCHNLLRVPFVVCIKGLHVCSISKVYNVVRFDIVDKTT